MKWSSNSVIQQINQHSLIKENWMSSVWFNYWISWIAELIAAISFASLMFLFRLNAFAIIQSSLNFIKLNGTAVWFFLSFLACRIAFISSIIIHSGFNSFHSFSIWLKYLSQIQQQTKNESTEWRMKLMNELANQAEKKIDLWN